MYPQDNITVDYEQLERQDRELERLQLEQLHLPGLRLPDPSEDEPTQQQELDKEVENVTSVMPASFYQNLPDWDKQNAQLSGWLILSSNVFLCLKVNLEPS